MMNILDALRYRLGGPMSDTEGEPLDAVTLDMLRGNLDRPLPPGLPLVVQDAIRNQPSYQEGGQFMAAPWSNPNVDEVGEPDLPREDPERRDYRLNDLLGFNRWMRREGEWPVPEGATATPLSPGQSPYAAPSALNQLLRRGPFGQYLWRLIARLPLSRRSRRINHRADGLPGCATWPPRST